MTKLISNFYGAFDTRFFGAYGCDQQPREDEHREGAGKVTVKSKTQVEYRPLVSMINDI